MRTLPIVLLLVLATASAQEKLPRVKVIATGGTIANTPSGRLHAGEVVEAIPQLKSVARLDVEELMRVGSSAITVANWLALSKRINQILAKEEDVKAVVVTHGSNTVEETAYFLGLTVKSDKPVVLTAAQRQFTTLSSDSPKNFLQAVRVAASDAARGKGALVVTNDTIIAAREVDQGDQLPARDVQRQGPGPARLRGRRPGELLSPSREEAHRGHPFRCQRPAATAARRHRLHLCRRGRRADRRRGREQGKAEGLVVAGLSDGLAAARRWKRPWTASQPREYRW